MKPSHLDRLYAYLYVIDETLGQANYKVNGYLVDQSVPLETRWEVYQQVRLLYPWALSSSPPMDTELLGTVRQYVRNHHLNFNTVISWDRILTWVCVGRYNALEVTPLDYCGITPENRDSLFLRYCKTEIISLLNEAAGDFIYTEKTARSIGK